MFAKLLKLRIGTGIKPAHISLAVRPNASIIFIGAVSAYLLCHLGLRLFESTSLRWDESEQTLFSQQLALGYNDQPPVYTWLLVCMFRVTGVSLVGVYLLKILNLAAIYMGAYAASRRLSSDHFAAFTAASLLLMPYFAWSALIDGAHTLLVTVFVPIAFILVLRLLNRPTTIGFILLGVVFGLGFLAKYSFALLVIALLLAMLTIPAHRHRLRDPRLLWTVAIGALVVLPHSIWVLHHWDLIRERPMHRGGVGIETSFLAQVKDGLQSLGSTAVLTLGPLVAVVTLLFPRECIRIFRRPAQADAVRLLGRWLIVLAALLLVLVLVGVTRFRTHWLIPAAVLLPMYLFARIAEAPVPTWRPRALFIMIVLAVGGVLAVRIAGIASESKVGGKYWAQDQLHDALAERIKTAGLERATFVGDHTLACGNLRLHCPDARIVCDYYPAFVPANLRAGPCCLIWEATYQPGLTPKFEEWLKANRLFDQLDWSDVQYVDMPIGVPARGLRRIGLMKLRAAKHN